MFKVLVLIIALLLAGVAYLFYQRSRPVLFRYSETGDPVKEPAFAIFNPFRDRAPEHGAEAFLDSMKAGQCEMAMSSVSGSSIERIRETCEREKNSPLVGWQLANRNDQSDNVRLYYRVNRPSYDGYRGQLWITVQKTAGDWKVVKYECIY